MGVSVQLARVVLDAAGPAGAAAAADAGVAPEVLADVDARIPHALHMAIWHAALARVPDPGGFPLAVAKRLTPGALGVLGYAFAHSATLDDALSLLARHGRLLYDELSVTRVDRGDDVVICYSLVGSPAPPPELFQATLAALVLSSRRLVGGTHVVRTVLLRHHASGLGERIGVPVRTGCDEDAVVVPRSLLAHPVAGADPDLLAILARHAGELLERLPPAGDLVADVRRVLLESPRATPAEAARALGIGPRTLQRRLREAGRTLREVHDEVRRERAHQYLADPERSVDEVAFLLGFAEPSAFYRAFRRWTGHAPRGRDRMRLPAREAG